MNPPPSHAPTEEAPDDGFIPIPRTLKRQIKDGIVAFTVAVWFFVRPWSHLLLDRNSYFNKLPATPVQFLALAMNIFFIALFIWLGIGLWRRTRSWLLSLVLDLLFLSLLIFPLDYIRVQVFSVAVGGVAGFFKHPATIPVLVVLLAVLLWKHRLIARGVAMVVVVTFPLALFTLAKIILLGLSITQLKTCTNQPAPPPLLAVRAGQPRVLWIIFDETDYRLAFEKRLANVALPEFDRLRNQSLSADHAFPPGSSTIISMPALITGWRLDTVGHDDCDMALTRADNGVTTDWSAAPTVFSQARELGFNTALVGWYHPYSRVLGGSLNYCSWYAMPGFELARATTFDEAVHEQFAALAGRVRVRQLFIDICKKSLADASVVTTNPTYGLILLHLPPPHAPAVYLPAKNEFTCFGVELPAGYFNNLMLADHELGVLRRGMEASGLWDNTWVILSADHWWRKSEVYDNISDHRVPFLVKSPGASQSIPYSHQFNTILTHDLILAILHGQVTNQAGVAGLLDGGKPDLPVIHTGEGSE